MKLLAQHGLKILYCQKNFAHFRNTMRKTWIMGLIDINTINENFNGDWTYELIWERIIKPEFESKIYPNISNILRFTVKQFVEKYESQYIYGGEVSKWNVSTMPITSTGNIESSNRAITKKLGYKPTMGRFITNLNSYIEQNMRKFEQFIKYRSMDRRKRKVVLMIENRNSAIDQGNNINQYLQLMVDAQFADSYLNKFTKTVDFDNMSESDDDEQKEYSDNNNNNSNHDNDINSNYTSYNNSNQESQNTTVLTDSASEYKPNLRNIKCKQNKTEESDNDSASDFLETPKKKKKKK